MHLRKENLSLSALPGMQKTRHMVPFLVWDDMKSYSPMQYARRYVLIFGVFIKVAFLLPSFKDSQRLSGMFESAMQ